MATRPELHIAVAKTKSKASDYNDNFTMMMNYVDAVALEEKTYVDGFMPSISGQSGKFLTNNGTVSSWASLGNQPFGDIINGLVITKSSDDTINVSAGSCYDYVKAVILANGTAATKQNESQIASTTYYVYIIDGANTDFLITTSSSSPTLPTGSTTYRQIGYYTTDGDNKIDTVSYYGESATSDKSVGGILNAIMPDYSAGISISSGYVAPSVGICYISGYAANSLTTLSVNGIVVGYVGYHDGNNGSISIPVNKGDKVTSSNSSGQWWFFPLKGVTNV